LALNLSVVEYLDERMVSSDQCREFWQMEKRRTHMGYRNQMQDWTVACS
jgi:hypothetical protein